MRIVIGYESMYGNTRAVALAIAEGMQLHDVAVLPISAVDAEVLRGADLVVLGAPTHILGLSRPNTRAEAADASHKRGSDRHLEPTATGPGLREWLAAPPPMPPCAAVFDTRMRASIKHAAGTIRRRLRHSEAVLIDEPQSFLVDKFDRLLPGQLDRARAWGRTLSVLTSRRANTGVS